MHHKSQRQCTSTDNLKLELKIQSRKKGETKSPPPSRRNQMLCAIYCPQNRQDIYDINQPIVSYDEPDLCNDHISKKLGSNDRFCINFPCHYVLGHVLSDIDPLEDVDSWKEVVPLTRKARSVGPHKSKPM